MRAAGYREIDADLYEEIHRCQSADYVTLSVLLVLRVICTAESTGQTPDQEQTLARLARKIPSSTLMQERYLRCYF